jgi:NAD(P)-dependent dehydrogenase (short-subunit alcohol dehydrogenase family)
MINRTSALCFASVIVSAIVAKRLLRTDRVLPRQVVIITGGSSGLGLALAHRFGKAGLRLVLAARDSEDLEKARSELLSSGSVTNEDDVLLVSCDVSEKDQATGLIAAALNSFRQVDILINNAGIIEVGPAEDQSVEAYENAISTDFLGAVYTTYAALPHLLAKRQGSIVNISSIGGKIAFPHLLPYVSAKFALTGFSEGLHAELRSKGIRVTTVWVRHVEPSSIIRFSYWLEHRSGDIHDSEPNGAAGGRAFGLNITVRPLGWHSPEKHHV